ncbi:MAG TPA: RcnB family protein, partial [Allosphingosinicella sp.]
NDRRYDWYGYRNRYRDNYRLGRYYDPYGYGYRRFSIGIQIGRPFYSQRYWISDPWQYRLPHAYAGTQWVRYYNDVLLVDTWTGEVLDVIHDFFW